MSNPKTRPRYSPEVRDRAVRMVLEPEGDYSSRWAAIEHAAGKIGCVAQTLDQWIKRAERDKCARTGLTTDVALRPEIQRIYDENSQVYGG
jgi:transposase